MSKGGQKMDDMTVARQALAMLKQNMAAAECHMAAINHYRTLALDAISLLEKMCAAPQPLTADEVKLKETVEPVFTAPVDEIVDQQPAEEAVDANHASSDVITADQSTETDAHKLAPAADVVEEPPALVEEKPKPRSKKKTKAKAEPESKPEQPQPEPTPKPEQPQAEQPAPEPVQPADQPAADGQQVSRVVDMQTRVIELHYTQPEIEVMEQTFTNLVEFVKAHPGANEQSADPAAFEEFRATVTALPSEDELCTGVTEQLRKTMVNDLRYDVLLFLPSQRALTVAEWARTQLVKINGYDEFMANLQDQLTAAKTAPEPEQKPEPAPVETVEVQPEDIEPAPANTPTAPLLTAEGTPPVSVIPQETSWADVEQEIAADRELATTAIMQAMTDGQSDVDDFKKDPTPTTSEGITVVDPQAERKAAQEEAKPEPTPAPEQTVDPTAKPMPWPEEDDPFANYTPDGKPADDQPFDPKNYEKINLVPEKFMDVFLLKAQSIYDKLAKDFPDEDQELDRRTVAYENALEVARLMDGGNDELTAVQKVGPRIGRQVMLLKGNRS